jgi:type IV secretory pathway VirJ component
MQRLAITFAVFTILFASALGSGVVVRPANARSDTFAIIITGDGGWRAIDRDIAEVFNDNGVSVIGLCAPEFLAERKTPAEASQIVEGLIRKYAAEWHRPRVILVGYSRGAGVIPFTVSRMPPAIRAHIAAIGLIGLNPAIDFKTSPLSLLSKSADELTIPVRPELRKLQGERVLCIAGQRDADAICRTLPPALATAILLPGDHHLNGNYRPLAEAILRAADVRTPPKIALGRIP